MRNLILTIVLMVLSPVLPISAEDWTTTDGKTYKSVTVIKSDAETVTVLDADGGAKIDLSKLSPDLQKRFNYDPVKAQAEADQRAKEAADQASMAASLKAMEDMTYFLNGGVMQVQPNGVLVSAQIVKGDKFKYVYGQDSEIVFVECDTNGMVDDQTFLHRAFRIGTYSYTNTLGARATIPRYTTSPKTAAAYVLTKGDTSAAAN